jgi:hypothetical protein
MSQYNSSVYCWYLVIYLPGRGFVWHVDLKRPWKLSLILHTEFVIMYNFHVPLFSYRRWPFTYCTYLHFFFCFKGKVSDVPMCMSINNNLIYVGDSKGLLHLINPAQGQLDIVDVSSSKYVLEWRPAYQLNSQFQKHRHALHMFFFLNM